MAETNQTWWEALNHGGLLIGPKQLAATFPDVAKPLDDWTIEQLRRRLNQFAVDGKPALPDLLTVVLEKVAGLDEENGDWRRDPGNEWSRTLVTGESAKPRRVWTHPGGTAFPIFVSEDERLGIGRGVRSVSRVLEWLRKGSERIALLTNGRQWRLIHAGLDHDAWAQWDTEQWFAEGEPGPQVAALQILLSPEALLPKKSGDLSPLLAAIDETRKGQAEVSSELGERVRKAVELLIQAHATALDEKGGELARKDIYLAAVRMVMRMVVILFAEARDLLPRDNALYFGSYGLQGLREILRRAAGGRRERLRNRSGAWPRVLALFRLVYDGSPHRALPVPRYGGELFRSGLADGDDGIRRAVHLFENAAFQHEVSDDVVYEMLELITTTHVRVRQGNAAKVTRVPVNFADLSTEYIGMLYEGLLGYELRRVSDDDEAIIFLNLGDQPALPLKRLEAMNDKALENLVDKFKKKVAAVAVAEDDSEEDEEEEAADGTTEEDTEEEVAVADIAEEAAETEADSRQVIRDRAVNWAKRAVVAGNLVNRPRAKGGNAESDYQMKVGEKAKQITGTAYLPGQYFLIRSSGTRKGSGTFYTRPALAIPTTHRTLRPLAYIAPNGEDGEPNELAPPTDWTPRKPEEILALKVCDPACGSASFAALRFLTDALYASLHHHGRIREHGDGALVTLAEGKESTGMLAEETLPSRPADPSFEPRLKTRLKRYVVERCIYGVDNDRLAIELARMALWIETMDRELPFEFLDHRVRSGNSLVGCWFDAVGRYPVMAWKYREAGDKSHSNGMHYGENGKAQTLKLFREKTLLPDLRSFLAGGTLFSSDVLSKTASVRDYAAGVLGTLALLPVADAELRSSMYREKIVESEAVRHQVQLMDRWSSVWFWPIDEIASAPLPTTLLDKNSPTGVFDQVQARVRPFHWELEFPDVFTKERRGFDAVIGNPPWENAQSNPEEYFSRFDPLFRTYSRVEKREAMRALFADDSTLERDWLRELEWRKAFANWVRWASNPLGRTVDGWEVSVGPETPDWYERLCALTQSEGHSDWQHPFTRQVGRIFTYKLFLELGIRLLREDGVLSFIVPAGIYGDAWSQPLRELFADEYDWRWLFAFENRARIFAIHDAFKFCVVIVRKRRGSTSIATSFGHVDLADWAADPPAYNLYSRELVATFSPQSRLLLEIDSPSDVALLQRIHGGLTSRIAGSEDWDSQYSLEFMMNSDSRLFQTPVKLLQDGYRRDQYSRWLRGNWRRTEGRSILPRVGEVVDFTGDYVVSDGEIDDVALPVYEGRMIGQFDFAEKKWVSGRGRGAIWEPVPWHQKVVEPQYLMFERDFRARLAKKRDARIRRTRARDGNVFGDENAWWARQTLKIGFMDVSSPTNARTMIATIIPNVPCGNTVPVLNCEPQTAAALTAVLNSFVFDYVMRRRLVGLHINSFVIDEAPLPYVSMVLRELLSDIVLRLAATDIAFAPAWLAVKGANGGRRWQSSWILGPDQRRVARAVLESIIAAAYGLSVGELNQVLAETDLPVGIDGARLKGFWRVDQHLPPEERLTGITRRIFAELTDDLVRSSLDEAALSIIRRNGVGISTDLDDRGSSEWVECQIHARNILGENVYRALVEPERFSNAVSGSVSTQNTLF